MVQYCENRILYISEGVGEFHRKWNSYRKSTIFLWLHNIIIKHYKIFWITTTLSSQSQSPPAHTCAHTSFCNFYNSSSHNGRRGNLKTSPSNRSCLISLSTVVNWINGELLLTSHSMWLHSTNFITQYFMCLMYQRVNSSIPVSIRFETLTFDRI